MWAYASELLSAVVLGFAAYEYIGCVTSALELLSNVAWGERLCSVAGRMGRVSPQRGVYNTEGIGKSVGGHNKVN